MLSLSLSLPSLPSLSNSGGSFCFIWPRSNQSAVHQEGEGAVLLGPCPLMVAPFRTWREHTEYTQLSPLLLYFPEVNEINSNISQRDNCATLEHSLLVQSCFCLLEFTFTAFECSEFCEWDFMSACIAFFTFKVRDDISFLFVFTCNYNVSTYC